MVAIHSERALSSHPQGRECAHVACGRTVVRRYQEAACERVAQAVWGDSMGFLRASWLSAQPAAAASARALAVEYAERRWAAALELGGQIFVKEGGQSDFTAEVVRRLEDRWSEGGRCVHVVQHSVWNEDMNSENVTDFIIGHVDYLGPRNNGRGPITDGNGPLQMLRGRSNVAFVQATRQSVHRNRHGAMAVCVGQVAACSVAAGYPVCRNSRWGTHPSGASVLHARRMLFAMI